MGGVVAGIGSVVGGIIGADGARDAANTQAKSIRDAAKTSAAAAEAARAEILDRMAPALATFRREMGNSVNTIRAGETSIMDVLQRSTGQANQLLANAGADAMAAIMGSRASAQGVPRQTFEQQYATGAYTGGAPPQQYQPAALPTAPTTMAATTPAPAAAEVPAATLAGTMAAQQRTGGRGDWFTPASAAQLVTAQPVSQPVSIAQAAASPTTAEQVAAQDYATNQQIQDLARQATTAAGGRIALPGVAQMPQVDTTGIGFGGATEAIQQGLGGGLAALRAGTAQARSEYTPYSQAGQAAMQKEAALSGALGPEAQAAAQAEFTESPGQKYLREQQEKALLRSAAATGGLGGGRVLTALQEQAAGIAGTQQQQYLENLRNIATRGQQAAGSLAGLSQQLGISEADLMRMSSSEQAALAERTGLNVANLQQTIQSAQAANQMGLGQGLANIRAGTAADITGVQQGLAGTGLSAQQNISQILANLATQSGTNLANLQTQYGAAQAAGTAAASNIYGQMAQNLGQIAGYGTNQYLANQNPSTGLSGLSNLGGPGYYGNEAINF